MESNRYLIMAKNKKTAKTTKKKLSPEYITVNGSTYEKVSDTSVEVSLDLESDVLDDLTSLVKEGKFVSIGDAVRYILRRKLESEGYKI